MSSTVAVKAFAEGVTQQIKEHLPDEYRNVKCEVTQQQKNNGSIQTGIIFNIPGRELAPIIYMEPFYDQARSGEPLDKIMDDIVQVSEKALGVQELPKEINPANYDSLRTIFPADHQHKSESEDVIADSRINKWKICQ